MTRVFVNGISAKSAGGLSILTNFLKTATENKDSFNYVVTVPPVEEYKVFDSDRIQILPLNWRTRSSFVPLMNIFYLPRMAASSQCDLIFNLSDIPMKTSLPQVFLFDWAYAIYPKSIAWAYMSWRDYAVRSLKVLLFKRLIENVDITIAQTYLVKENLKKQYGIPNAFVIPNTHYEGHLSKREKIDFYLGEGFKCLFLSRYYSHKNFETLLPLAEIIQQRNNRIKIIVTLDRNESLGAEKFLKAIEKKRLNGVIKNIGSVPINQVPALFNQVDVLLMPTLLETLGLTYLESMYYSTPILTSDLPFAHDVCGDAAFYFDPLNPIDIMSTIETAVTSPALIETKKRLGREILEGLPDCQDTYLSYTEAFEQALRKKDHD